MAIGFAGIVRRGHRQDDRATARLASRVRSCLAGASDRWVWTLGIVGLVALVASRTASDANWDLRNYHLYNAHALITGRFWSDIAAAQLQTFLSPVMDIAMGAIRDRLNATPALCNAVLAMPHGVATALAFLLTLRVIPGELPGRAPLALAAVLFSAAGAAGLPTLATSMSEMLPGSCILAGLLLLTGDHRGDPRIRRAGRRAVRRCRRVEADGRALLRGRCGRVARRARSAGGAAAGVRGLVRAGRVCRGGGGRRPMVVVLYRHFGNPVLPFMNQLFHSPFVAPRSYTDDALLPARPGDGAGLSVLLGRAGPRAGERTARARPAFRHRLRGGGRGGRAGVAATERRRWRQRAPAPCWWCSSRVSFVLWELQFSVLRYLATLELLSGAVVLVALRPLLARPGLRGPAAAGFVCLCAVVQAVTVYPNWGRMEGTLPIRVRLPALEANALVVLLDPSPMAYLADGLPPSVRLAGANNNLIQPGGAGLLAYQAAAAIRTQAGPLYGLEDPTESLGIADRTLAYYRLRRGTCSAVQSNLDNNAIRLCRLWPDAE